MKTALCASLMVVVGLLAGAPLVAGQTATQASPVPALSQEEVEQFLLNATIGKTKSVSKGSTKARRVVMSDGRMTHDAQIQDVDVSRALFEAGKYSEVDFKDSYRYNIAAYRLARLLGLDNVPMSVERKVDGQPVAVTWWLDDVAMEEGDRVKKKIEGNGARRRNYWGVMRVFDELIQNRDRNGGNILWSSEWRMWMIDHTRAFRLGRELLEPKTLTYCDRALLDRIRELTRPALAAAVGRTLTDAEIDALFVRRDLILKLLDDKIATLGPGAVLYTLN